ncbi:MAG: restriction endonuclease [Phycisphaerales bacterium]
MPIPKNIQGKVESILKRWNINENELTQLIDENPSLRGMLFGYVAEYQFSKIWLNHPDVSYAVKPDDHNRKKKGNRVIIYKNKEYTIEVKSLQTAMIRPNADGTYSGQAQCDASDRRTVTFPDGSRLDTTCLLAGEFDVLAINCFGFRGQWDFAFAQNADLPRSKYRKYTEEQRKCLLASLVPVTWPPQPPFSADPYEILDGIEKA